jgi:peptidoglycan/LPS O-acetylase OafA/YrhL/Flp pilus assembly protein TadD
MQRKYFEHINGLRAFAMLAVAMNHSLIVFSIDGNRKLCDYPPFSTLEHSGEIIIRTLMLFFANGCLAVTLFFTLSGFFLGFSLDRFSKEYFTTYYGKFVLRRILRLYPVHIVILILITIYYNFLHQPLYSSVASQWFHFSSTLSGVTMKEFIRNLLFIDCGLNSVTWIMKHQMTAVFLLPFFHLLSRRLTLINNILVVFILYYISYKTELSILRYLFVFYLGLILPNARFIFQKINSNYKKIITLILVVILILPRSTLLASIFSNDYRIILCEAIGCFFLTGLLSYGHPIRFYNILLRRLPQSLGKISYSFFMIHFIILFILSSFLFNNLSGDIIERFTLLFVLILSASSIFAAYVIATFIYKYIEYPCIQYSNIFFLTEQKWTLPRRAMLLVLVSMIAIPTVGAYLSESVYERKAKAYLVLGKAYQDKYSTLGKSFQDKYLINESIKHFQAAVKLKPDFSEAHNDLRKLLSEAHNNLGILYNIKGMHGKAIYHYKRALSLIPSYQDVHYNLGNVYMLKGMMRKAEEHYLIAIVLDPYDPNAHNNLGAAYMKMGLTEKAVKQLLIAERLRSK